MPTMYDAFSLYYDHFVNWNERLGYEMPFIQQFLKDLPFTKEEMRILDAATGSGMHAIELARSGFSTYGCDLSNEMVKVAHANAQKANVQPVFKQAGFGEMSARFSDEKPFHAILCLGNSLPHVTNFMELQQALEDFYSCLKPGGIVILQNRNFDSVLAQRERWMEPQASKSANEEWLFLRFYDFEPDGMIQFNIITLHRIGQKTWQQKVAHTHLLPIPSRQLTAVLSNVGFVKIQLFGSMSVDSRFDPEISGNLVAVASKPA